MSNCRFAAYWEWRSWIFGVFWSTLSLNVHIGPLMLYCWRPRYFDAMWED